MKFCKECHRRMVEKIETGVDCSVGSIKICMCTGLVFRMHGGVIKRLNSEVGVHRAKIFLA